MSRVELSEGVYWVGAIDWNIRNFHGYTTPRGTTYNAYLIVDEKIALIDTVKAPFTAEMLDRIREIVDPGKIDYMVSNHVEMDHSGGIPEVMRRCQATVVTAERGKKGLTRVYKSDWPFQVVKEGEELSLGRRRLQFIEAPMLHWPDNILAYLPEQKLLFSSDAFGQHIASSWKYADQVPYVFSEAAKYYANIVMPYSSMVLQALKKLDGKGIEMVAPSHGLIWRGPELGRAVQAYTDWSQGVAREKVLICYDTMWGSTDKMARAVVEGILRGGVEVSLYNLSVTDWSETIKEVLDAKAVLIGSPTLNKGLFPTVAGFLAYLKGLKPKGKLGASFGSFGWSGGAVTAANQELKSAGMEVVESGLEFAHVPDIEELEKCVAFGEQVARQVKGG